MNGAGRWQLLWLLQLLLSNCADSVVDEEVNVEVEWRRGGGIFWGKTSCQLIVLWLVLEQTFGIHRVGGRHDVHHLKKLEKENVKTVYRWRLVSYQKTASFSFALICDFFLLQILFDQILLFQKGSFFTDCW